MPTCFPCFLCMPDTGGLYGPSHSHGPRACSHKKYGANKGEKFPLRGLFSPGEFPAQPTALPICLDDLLIGERQVEYKCFCWRENGQPCD